MVLPGVLEPVVQSAGPALPELDGQWLDTESAPERGDRDFSHGKFRFELLPFHFEKFSGRDHTALLRSPGSQLAFVRSAEEIFKGFRHGNSRRRPGDDDLPFQTDPREKQRNPRILGDLTRLPALQVRVKDKSAFIQMLQEHRAHQRMPVGTHRRQGHRVRLNNGFRYRLHHPFLKLSDGVGQQILLAEVGLTVVAAHGGKQRDVGVGWLGGHEFGQFGVFTMLRRRRVARVDNLAIFLPILERILASAEKPVKNSDELTSVIASFLLYSDEILFDGASYVSSKTR